MKLETTHLYREIHEQPVALARFLEREQTTAQQLAQAIRERGITHVVIAARGTSDNAARYAKYIWGAMNGLTVGLATPSLFSIYKKPPQFGNALVLGISQSGKSPDIVAVLAEAKRQGALTAVITNIPDSDLAQQGDFVIPLHAGDELAVAATKTYTCWVPPWPTRPPCWPNCARFRPEWRRFYRLAKKLADWPSATATCGLVSSSGAATTTPLPLNWP
jgi:glucosamine--fructose-6-phosphate aminotransferase (isomerizing)